MLTGSVPFTGDTPVEIAMKHLSQAPGAAVGAPRRGPARPRLRRPARAREGSRPSATTRAEEMDADLARVARGIGVSRRDRGGGDAGARAARTSARRRRRSRPAGAPPAPTYTPGRYYEYDEPPRRRSIWPWLLALLLVAGALVGGWFVYQEIQDQLSATKPVAVPDVEGLAEQLAVTKIHDAGPEGARSAASRTTTSKVGLVSDQDPQPGDRIEQGQLVTILVSTGKPKMTVPDVVGQSRDDAVADLVERRAEGQRRSRSTR